MESKVPSSTNILGFYDSEFCTAKQTPPELWSYICLVSPSSCISSPYLQLSDSDTSYHFLLQPVLDFSAHGTIVLPDTQTQRFGVIFYCLNGFITYA